MAFKVPKWKEFKAAFTNTKAAYMGDPGISNLPNILYQAMYRYFSNAQPIWNPDNLESYVNNAYLANLNVYSIVSKIAKKASRIEPRLWVRKPDGSKELLPNTHEILQRLHYPNSQLKWNQLVYAYVLYKRICGNFMLFGIRLPEGVNKGILQELYVMPVQNVNIIGGGWQQPILHYIINGFQDRKIEPADVLHIKYFNLLYDGTPSSLYGLSPLKAANRAVTQDNSANAALVSMYQNLGARGLLSRGNAPADIDFTSEQAAQIKEKYKAQFGVENYGDILITNTPASWQQIGLDAVDMSIIESKKMGLRDLCNVFDTPTEIMNDKEHSTYNNVKEARLAWINDAIIPDCDDLFEGLNEFFIEPFRARDKMDYWLDYDPMCFEELRLNQLETLKTLENVMFLSANEKRKICLFPEKTIEEEAFADKLLVTTREVLLDDVDMNSVVAGNSTALANPNPNTPAK